MRRTRPSAPVSPWWQTPAGIRLLERVSRGLDSPLRLRVLAALAAGERNVTTLTRLVHCPPSWMSKHLAVLRALGLVERRTEGNLRYYRLAAHEPAAQAVRALLLELTHHVGPSDHG